MRQIKTTSVTIDARTTEELFENFETPAPWLVDAYNGINREQMLAQAQPQASRTGETPVTLVRFEDRLTGEQVAPALEAMGLRPLTANELLQLVSDQPELLRLGTIVAMGDQLHNHWGVAHAPAVRRRLISRQYFRVLNAIFCGAAGMPAAYWYAATT